MRRRRASIGRENSADPRSQLSLLMAPRILSWQSAELSIMIGASNNLLICQILVKYSHMV